MFEPTAWNPIVENDTRDNSILCCLYVNEAV